MNVKAIYEEIGGNYEDVLQRVYSEENIKMLLPMFLEDISYELFLQYMTSENYEQATEEIHGLKGICSNLSITSLFDISMDILTALRTGKIDYAKSRVDELTECYKTVEEVLKKNI